MVHLPGVYGGRPDSVYLVGTLDDPEDHNNLDSDDPYQQFLRDEHFQEEIWQQHHVVCTSVEESCSCDRGSQCQAPKAGKVSKRLFVQDGGSSSGTPLPSQGVLPSPTRTTSVLMSPNNGGFPAGGAHTHSPVPSTLAYSDSEEFNDNQ